MQREKILIVDDSDMNRAILDDMLRENYDIIEAEDGLEAISILKKDVAELSLVLLDIVMPHMDGFGVLEAMNANGWIKEVPVVMVSAENSTEQVERAYNLGVTDFIMRPFDALVVRRRVLNTLLLYAKQKRLISMVEEQVYETEHRSDMMIDILSHIVEFRNGESGQHILHVRAITDLLLSQLTRRTGRYNLTITDISLISTASSLHDIGKIAIDEKILNKPGKLTNEEFEIMKTHSTVGSQMLERLPVHQSEPLVRMAREICRWHHERYDGRGYPDGLKGDEIPISAQVVALADVYDALTSERVYKPPFSHDTAVQMIVNGECGAFNPLLLECLVENTEQFRAIKDSDDLSETLRQSKLRSISQETLRSEGGGVSERTLRLLDRERMRNTFFASMSEAVQLEYSVSPEMLTVSAWGARHLGISEVILDPWRNESLRAVFGERTMEQFKNFLQNATPEHPEAHFESPLYYGGAIRWHRFVVRALWSDDEPPVLEGALSTVMDIHDAHLRMMELEQRASRDALTGLLNRASAREQIELRMQERPDSHYAFVIFDLDYFKTANDLYGHLFGDQVLRHVAHSLVSSVRRSDLTCRFGGDEFLIFLEYNTDIERTIDRIFHTLCGKYEEFQISVTLGAALGEDVGLSYDTMFRAADAALYAAKRAGRAQYRIYDQSLADLLDVPHDGEDAQEEKEEQQ